MEIYLHFNRSSSFHLNTYKVRIFGTIVFKTLSYLEFVFENVKKISNYATGCLDTGMVSRW